MPARIYASIQDTMDGHLYKRCGGGSKHDMHGTKKTIVLDALTALVFPVKSVSFVFDDDQALIKAQGPGPGSGTQGPQPEDQSIVKH